MVAWAQTSDLLTPNTPLTADNHSTPPDVTGLSERCSRHTERPQVASVRGVSRGYNHHTSVMETADGKFSCSHTCNPHLPFSPPAVCPSVCALVGPSVGLQPAADWPWLCEMSTNTQGLDGAPAAPFDAPKNT